MTLKVPPLLGLTQGVNGIEKTQYTTAITTEGNSGTNPFNGNLVGINENIGVGEYQSQQSQCGRKLGGITLAFA